MVKHIQGWEINRKLDYKQNVYVRQFSGAKINCMRDYVKPCTRENNPDHIIFHVGTNVFHQQKLQNLLLGQF